MKTKKFLPAILLTLLSGCAAGPPLQTVSSVDLKRYAGRWYEIARYPNWFQRSCEGETTAEYTPLPDGKIRVVNTCSDADGKVRSIRGTAVPVPGSGNSRLKVRFWGPFAGDYWVLALDPDYQWAIVGHPSRKYLWILSREPTMDDARYSRLLNLVREKGYDPTRLIRN